MRKPFPLGKLKAAAGKVGFFLPIGPPAHDPNPDLDLAFQRVIRSKIRSRRGMADRALLAFFIAGGTLF
jgi:hypothetical protein